jgi:hypothetical protein
MHNGVVFESLELNYYVQPKKSSFQFVVPALAGGFWASPSKLNPPAAKPGSGKPDT